MDLTHVTALEVGGQQYSRAGQPDIYHGRTRQRGCFLTKMSQKPSEQSHRLLKQKVFITAGDYRTLRSSPKLKDH